MVDIPRVDWYGCYDGSWQSAPLVAQAYSHPAKVSFNLAERIYRHMLAESWLSPGDAVLDPFGGVGGFAFHAALYGMHWTGVELEQKFVELGGQNLALWQNRYAPHFPGYGTARLVQGDSRRLVEVVRDAGGIVSSPPYADAQAHPSIGAVSKDSWGSDGHDIVSRRGLSVAYGSTPGQLGAMPAGAIVSSPPYSETRIDGNGDEGASGLRDENGEYLRGAAGWQKRKELGARYGADPANLGNMPAGVVSSPPFENGVSVQDTVFYAKKCVQTGRNPESAHAQGINTYGTHAGNIGNNTGSTFWSAASLIVQQCYDILRPGGYAAWVCGDFVRNKKRVLFGEQWLALCMVAGFEPVLWAVAWKAESYGEQLDIFGNGHEQGKTKVSFFRRLANQKSPDTAIVNEDVVFVRKPL